MRLFFLLVILSLRTFNAYSQKPPKPGYERGNPNCVYKNKYSANKRLGFYPFNESEKVKLVSFRYNMDNITVRKDTVLLDSVIESKQLSAVQVDSLTDILYNNFYKKRPNYDVSSCFWPRNAILFYDSKGKLKESIVLCFHCGMFSVSSNKVNMGDDCDQKIEKLKAFFIKSGLSFGTADEPLFYPGEKYQDEGIIAPVVEQE